MSILTRDKVTEIYCIADDFCKELAKNSTNLRLEAADGRKHRNRACAMSDSVTLIANLLCTIISRMIKRRCSFSQVVTMARLMLMYYVDFIAFMEAPDASWESIGFRADIAPPDGI